MFSCIFPSLFKDRGDLTLCLRLDFFKNLSILERGMEILFVFSKWRTLTIKGLFNAQS